MELNEAKKLFISFMRAKYYRDGTIESYVSSLVRFGGYLKTHPQISGLSRSKKIEGYLSWRVEHDDISPSTQNVELNALVLFHHSILGADVSGINAIRAKRTDRIPPILSREQVRSLIAEFPYDLKLIPMILYGCGMRINECLRLRIKDVDFVLEKFTIHEAKGNKERIIAIPQAIMDKVKVQYDKAVMRWSLDRHHIFNGVNCGGIEKKYPSYPMSKEWYWLFPASNYSSDPKTNTPMMRHHIMAYTIQRVFEDVRKRAGLPIYATPHVMRHACLTHMAEDMLKKGFPEKMVKAQLKELSGHVLDETLEGYLHLAAPMNSFVVSPIEGLV